MSTVRFIMEGVGRKEGHVEDVADETLVDAWVKGGMVVQVKPAVGQASPDHKAPDAPPKDTAPRKPEKHRAILHPRRRR